MEMARRQTPRNRIWIQYFQVLNEQWPYLSHMKTLKVFREHHHRVKEFDSMMERTLFLIVMMYREPAR